MEIPIDEIRVIVLILTLLYASYTDIKSRKVSDNVWVPGLIVGLVITGYEMVAKDPYVVASESVISVAVVGIISYLLYRYRIFYGADYKAFIFVAVIMPVSPEILNLPLYGYDLGSVDPRLIVDGSPLLYLTDLNAHLATQLFGFTVLVNSSLFGFVYFLLNIYHNIRDGNFEFNRPLRSASARKMSSSDITDLHVQVIEPSESDNLVRRGFEFIKNGIQGVGSEFYSDYLEWHRDQKFNSPSDTLSDIEEFDIESFSEDSDNWIIDNPEEDKEKAMIVLNNDKVWVTPGIPYIVPITLGVLSAIVLGNIWYFIMLVL